MNKPDDNLKTENRSLMGRLLLLAVGMFGFGFAMVPLYGLLCQVTGVQSVEQRAAIQALGAVVPSSSE